MIQQSFSNQTLMVESIEVITRIQQNKPKWGCKYEQMKLAKKAQGRI